jgi:DNA-binding response OmpR family regulator
MGQATILIADDDPDILETLTFRLEQRGYRVIQTHDGEEAMELFRTSSPDLVVLDVMMPKENGYRVARMIKEDTTFRKIPVILLTARNLEAYPEREKMFMDFSHADEVVYKPFEMERLLESIIRLLGGNDSGVGSPAA